jgi:hypothetical protein
MADEADQTLHATGEPAVDENKSASGSESDVPMTSSSSNAVVVKMVNKSTPSMFDYWKKSTITEADRSACHVADWLESLLLVVDRWLHRGRWCHRGLF